MKRDNPFARIVLIRSRCETRPDFHFWPISGDLAGFLHPGGTSYHPLRESVPNRKIAENNFFLYDFLKNN